MFLAAYETLSLISSVMFVLAVCFLFLLMFWLGLTAGARVYFHGVFPHPRNHSFQEKVNELAQRQYTAAKEQAHVATELAW